MFAIGCSEISLLYFTLLYLVYFPKDYEYGHNNIHLVLALVNRFKLYN